MSDIEKALNRDTVAIYRPIANGLDISMRDAVEANNARNKNGRVVVIIDTPE